MKNSKVQFVRSAIVVFTDGVDRANSCTELSSIEEARKSESLIIAVKLADDAKPDSYLQQIGRDGYYEANSTADLENQFGIIATNLERESMSNYLIAHCSAVRRSSLENNYEIVYKINGYTGSIVGEIPFNARGITGGCSLSTITQPCGVDKQLLKYGSTLVCKIPTVSKKLAIGLGVGLSLGIVLIFCCLVVVAAGVFYFLCLQ